MLTIEFVNIIFVLNRLIMENTIIFIKKKLPMDPMQLYCVPAIHSNVLIVFLPGETSYPR